MEEQRLDTHHTWNDGKPIRSKKQSCGCHVTAKKFDLCDRGKDFWQSAKSCYGLWSSYAANEVESVDLPAMRGSFELERDIYLEHLRTGKDRPFSDEMAAQRMEKKLAELRASGVISANKFKDGNIHHSQHALTGKEKGHIQLFLAGKCTDGYMMTKLGIFEWKDAEKLIEQYKKEVQG